VIQPSDTDFAIDTIARRHRASSQARAARQATAGIAWERTLIAHVQHLADTHDTLEVIAERWCPAGKRLDLDLIVHDSRKAVLWILDAKLATPHNSHIGKLHDQIRLLKHRDDLTLSGPTPIGLLVHHRRQLTPSPQATNHPNILRCTLQEVADLLLTRRLPHWHEAS